MRRTSPSRRRRASPAVLAVGVILGFMVAGCDGDKPAGGVAVRIGYLPNITHAPAIIGVEDGLFATALGSRHELRPVALSAGPEAVEALFAEALDFAFIGPNPAITAFARSKSAGGAIRIIAGSTSGGAALVTRAGITSPDDLHGATLATPQLGGTQDVALRGWLQDQGLDADTAGGGDVSIQPRPNADTLTAFRAGDIDRAWVPEPWVSRLVIEGGAHVLVEEQSLWPAGAFVTTHLVVRTQFLRDHPEIVERVLRAHLAALDTIARAPAAAAATTNRGIGEVTGKALAAEVVDAAWSNLAFTVDPVASSLGASAEAAVSVGLLDAVDLDGIYDLEILNSLLVERGHNAVNEQ